MGGKLGNFVIVLASLVIFGIVRVSCLLDILQIKFYKNSCPQAEDIVRNITESKVQNDPVLAAKLLRMHFHDCFVRGCDGSVLLDTVGTSLAEKDAVPNLSLARFEVIDEIKTEIEKVCPGVVSCADILALAARDAVSFPFNEDLWEVPTGRRDGSISIASEAVEELPLPSADFNTLKKAFATRNLDVDDLVALSGAHTIGISHCAAFTNRLYNFTGNGDQDPSLNATYAESLKQQCPNNPLDLTSTVENDPQSSLTFDNHYYTLLKQNKGLFQSDAALLTDKISAKIVEDMFRSSSSFFFGFGKAMKKMGAIGVLTRNDGEIRKNCRKVN